MSNAQANNHSDKSINRVIDTFHDKNRFPLDCGKVLDEIEIMYETYGMPNEDRSNVVLICHALTGGANVAGSSDYSQEIIEKSPMLDAVNGKLGGWWKTIIGPGKLFDTSKYFILSSNILGSCYGSSGPASINPVTGKKYGNTFPQVTVRDMVRAQKRLIDHLGIDQLAMAIGGSLGGMQVLEWAVMFPDVVRSIVPVATSARHSDWSISLNHIARQAILNDPVWDNGNYTDQPYKGLSLARKIGMISYRTDLNFNNRFNNNRSVKEGDVFDKKNIFETESYLDHHGNKLGHRFDANTFLTLSHAMDLHDLSRDRGSLKEALGSITCPAVCIGIDSDILYPAHEQKAIANSIQNSIYCEIESEIGHDAFLIEFEQITKIVKPLLAELFDKSPIQV